MKKLLILLLFFVACKEKKSVVEWTGEGLNWDSQQIYDTANTTYIINGDTFQIK